MKTIITWTKPLLPAPCSLLPILFFLFSLFPFTSSLYASPYDMILTGDPVIEDIRYLSLETGVSVLSFTPPFAPHEIQQFLSRIDENELSFLGLESYNRILNRLNPETPLSLSWENFQMFFNVKSTLEARARFNKEIDYPENPKIPSSLSLAAKFFFADTVQLYFDPEFSLDPEDYSFNGHNSNGYFANNILVFNNFHVNGNSPLKTFIAAGGPLWNFQLGRDQLSYGAGISGNLGIMDNPPFYEFMRLSLFSKYFKYSLLVIQSPLHVKTHNALIDTNIYDLDELIKNGVIDKTTQRYFYIHRVDFNLFNRVSVGLMEGVMAGNSGLEIRLLNPLMIIHNAMTWRNYDDWTPEFGHMIGSFFSAEVNWNIYKSISFYAQFVMNEYAIGPETEEGRLEAPNGLGYMAGFQYSYNIKNYSGIAYLESFYTWPFLYINKSPFGSLIYMNMIGFVHSNFYYYWFGYPRDSFSVTAGTRIRNLRNNIGLEMGFSWIASGEKNKNGVIWDHFVSWENFDLKSPSGIVENRFILSLGAKWDVYSWLSLRGTFSGMYFTNNKHEEGENALSGLISLSVTFRY